MEDWGAAPVREEGVSVYVFDHKDVVIPQELFDATRWTKTGQVDKRYTRGNKPMLDWIELHGRRV